MKRYKFFMAVFIMISTAGISKAQLSPLKELKIGDTLPDIEIKMLMNYSTTTLKTSDLKGKAIILDFCNVTCSYCTEDMPRLMALKQQFKGKLEVIRVTRNNKKQVETLFNRSELARGSNLPISVSDTVFSQLFPVKAPHQAWIDPGGVVRAITDSRNTGPQNIKSLVKGDKIDVSPAKYYEKFNSRLPLYAENRINLQEYTEQYSLITKYINGIGDKLGFTSDPATGQITRRAFYNMPLILLLKFCFGGFDGNKFGIPSDNRKVILNVKDPSRFLAPEDPSLVVPWEWNNTWCYEVQVSPEQADRLPYLMQSDLTRYFNLSVGIEKRKLKGLALVKLQTKEKLFTKGVNAPASYNTLTKRFEKYNSPISGLVETLTYMLDPYIVVDETGITRNIDFSILKSSDILQVRKELWEYGLDLVEKEVETEMLVISDK